MPKNWREARRKRAFELRQLEWSARRIAEAFGISEAAVSHWFSKSPSLGRALWQGTKRKGRPPKLTQEQFEMIPEMLSHGPEAWGFRGELWTCSRVAAIIRCGLPPI